LKLRPYIAIATIIASLLYLIFFYLAFNLDLNELLLVIGQLDLRYLMLSMLLRLSSLFLHTITWYLLLRIACREVPLGKVITIVLIAVAIEFLIPIGGAAEAIKVLLITQLTSTPSSIALAALLMHRQLIILTTLITTLIAIYWTDIPWSASITIILPILGLFALNTVVLLTPSHPKFETLVDRLVRRFNTSLAGFSNQYKDSLRSIVDLSKPELYMALMAVVLEKISNSLYGVCLGASLSIHIDILRSLLAFDSIYAVIWLLPLITPGNLGIFETIQILLLKILGITSKSATLLALTNRVVMVVAEYPLLPPLSAYLGIHLKQLASNVSEFLRNNKSKYRNS